MAYERKTNYTRQQLQESLLARIEEKPFEKITVNDIVTPIHLNRSTFYRYYDDKYQLIDEIERNLIKELNERNFQPWEMFDPYNSLDQVRAFVTESLALYQERTQLLHALLGPNGDHSFEERLANEFKRNFRQRFPDTTPELQLIQEMMLAMSMQAFRYQLFHPTEITPDQIIELILGMIHDGPIGYLATHYPDKKR